MKRLPIFLVAFAAVGCSSSSSDLTKEDEGKMKDWLQHGIPANKGGAPPTAAPLKKNDPKTGTPTD